MRFDRYRCGSRLSWGAAVLTTLLLAASASAQTPNDEDRARRQGSIFWPFLGGAVLGLGAPEAGHLAFDVVFDAEPRLKKVEFAGIPFFHPDARWAVWSSRGLKAGLVLLVLR